MSNYLEIDPKILERNLLLQEDSNEVGDFEKFLRSPVDYVKDNAPWKLATPTAGFCVKTSDLRNNKIFINVCKLDEIPEPKDISPAQLLEIWQSEDSSDFKVPLSIQDPHDELDKSGNPTVAYDVALNTNFFHKVESDEIFKSFVLQVILEGLENKYDLELKKESYVILQNRKRLGELKPHRIRCDKGNSSSNKSRRPLIQELSSSTQEQLGDSKATQYPTFRIFQNIKKNFAVGEFYLPKVVSQKDVNVNVGENRIVLNSVRGSYQSDVFLPFAVDENSTTARFNINTKILTLKMPIISVK